MATTNDVHEQFAEYFKIDSLKPFAYLLSKGLSEGSICLDLGTIDAKKAELPARYQTLLNQKASLNELPLIANGGFENQPFIRKRDKLYLQRYYRYETACLNRLHLFITSEQTGKNERTAALMKEHAFISRLFKPADKNNRTNGGDWQLAAAITAALNNFSIITGGPGTGKTTTVAKLLAILYRLNPDLKVALAAPTGKAAARMAESLRNTVIPAEPKILEKFKNLTPSTIHRLLKVKRNSPYFHQNAANPLPHDVVIIDESSMIDVALFAKLLSAIGPETRLILLGDKDQLAAVEAGSLFGDLCMVPEVLNKLSEDQLVLINKFAETPGQLLPATALGGNKIHPLYQHIIALTHSHRFEEHKGIGMFSNAVINNKVESIRSFFQKGFDDQVVIDMQYTPLLFEEFIVGYKAFILEEDIREALKKLTELRVLCAVREGAYGLYATNKTIEAWLNKNKMINLRFEFYENRPLILNKNYYEHGLFNGDTGIIRRNEQGTLMAWFEDSSGNLKSVLPGYLNDAETAFAMTVHKSQGSEFGEVLVILPQTADAPVLTRELLYTAVTRTKHKVYIQATEEVLLQTAARSVERASGIAERLINP